MDKRRIVIIDDNKDQRTILKGFMEELGCEVVGEGKDGFDAIELVQKLLPDAILMDIKMPGMNGIEAATAINQLSPAPVVLLTGKQDKETLRMAVEAGVMAYMVKPVRQEELLPTIELAISRFNEFQDVRKENIDLKQTIEARKVIERAKGLLMEKERLTEKEAFSRIQKISMDQRRSMKEIAEILITALEDKRAKK